MKLRELNKIMNLNYDLLNIFTDYVFILDYYFKDEKNKKEHSDLYNEYQILNENLKNSLKRNGFDKI